MNGSRASSTSTPVRFLTTILIGIAATLSLTSEATASPGAPAQIPIFQLPYPQTGLDRRQPPRTCSPINDGEQVVWDGWVWICSYSGDDIPPWQWEPLRKA